MYLNYEQRPTPSSAPQRYGPVLLQSWGARSTSSQRSRSTGLTSKEFAIGLLEKKSVAVVPGTAFGAAGEGFVRCCYATAPELIDKAMDLMEEYVNEVRK